MIRLLLSRLARQHRENLRLTGEILRLRGLLADMESEAEANLALAVGVQAQLAERSAQLLKAIGHPAVRRPVTIFGSPN